MPDAKSVRHQLWHQSGVNPKGDPFVQLTLDGKLIAQLTPDQARENAFAMIQAAEAAEQDAFLFDWVINHIGGGVTQAAGLMVDFRKYREERTGKHGGPTSEADWVFPDSKKPQ